MRWLPRPLLLLGLLAGGCRLDPTPAPAQPIAFNHELHAGAQKIECVACHVGAESAANASLPPLRLCLTCHMRPQGNPPSAAEQRVRELAGKRGPFRWIQVNRNPGHVYFSHAAHTVSAGMPCAACHGDVTSWRSPPRLPEPRLHDMDTCMACHRERGASNSCTTCHR